MPLVIAPAGHWAAPRYIAFAAVDGWERCQNQAEGKEP